MQWRNIIEIDASYEYLSAETKKNADALNERIHELRDKRATLSGKIDEARGLEITESMDVSVKLGKEVVHLLNEEFRVRRDWELLDDKIRQATGDQIPIAQTALNDLKENLKKSLLDLGYLPFNISDATPGRIKPGWINNHPKVRAADGLVEQLRYRHRDVSSREVNREAMVSLGQELQRMRDRALAPLRDYAPLEHQVIK